MGNDKGHLVALMAKYPERGKVKTRLAASVGDDKALEIYRALLRNAIDKCRPEAESTYRLGCFVTPEERVGDFVREYPGFDFYLPQSEGHLGLRMEKALEKLLALNGGGRAALIGADIPDLSREHIEDAFRKLDESDIVWGPTDDGGYYLIAMKGQVYREVLSEEIEWGGPEVLGRSLRIATDLQLNSMLLDRLTDVDSEADL